MPLNPKNRIFYGWVVVLAFFFSGTILYGIRFIYGVFFKSIEAEFMLNRATTSAVFSAYLLLGSVFAFGSSWALERFGPRALGLFLGLVSGLSLVLTSRVDSAWQLFLTYSLLLSMGHGPMFVVSMSTVMKWFQQKRGLAIGIVTSAAGLGTIVLAPVATYLIGSLDWRTAFGILGLVTWLGQLPLSLLFRNPPPARVEGVAPEPKETGGTPRLSLSQLVRKGNFWIFTSIWFFGGASLFLVITHIVPFATDVGIPPGGAAAILSLLNGISIGGRIFLGGISDRAGRKKTAAICALFQVGALVSLVWADNLGAFFLFALVYGVAHGGMTTVITALIGDTVGTANIAKALGVLDLGWGLGAALGPALGGLIFDLTQSYTAAFLMGAAAMAGVAIAIALVRSKARTE